MHSDEKEKQTWWQKRCLKTMANTPCDAGGGGEAADEVSRWF
jgi:hypothetical protein